MSASRTPNCAKCRHFFVTWDQDFPRGCKAYGFRAMEYPSFVVQRESGIECQLFEKRRQRPATDNSDRTGRLVH